MQQDIDRSQNFTRRLSNALLVAGGSSGRHFPDGFATPAIADDAR